MNKPPKKQHYLPCVYLQQFSTDGMNATRKSKVWRLSAKECRAVPVDTQCVKPYFYSKTDPESAEAIFRPIEKLYGKAANKIWANSNAKSKREYYGIILAIFGFHLRGAMYLNSTGRETIEAFRLRFGSFRDSFFIPEKGQPVKNEEFIEHIQKFWRVRLLKAANYDFLIASDNPSLWFVSKHNERHFFFVLPITPLVCAVAYDTRFFTIKGNCLSQSDLVDLNLHQIYHCLGAIYSHKQLDEKDMRQIRARWMNREKPVGDTEEKSWTASYLHWKGKGHFSFIEPIEIADKI